MPDKPARSTHHERLPGLFLNTLSLAAIVIDQEGMVIAADRDKADDATPNSGDWVQIVQGMNYVYACDTVEGPDASLGHNLAAGIRDILAGKARSFELEYKRRLADGEHHFIGRVTRIPGRGQPQAVVTHTDVTLRKYTEASRQVSQSQLHSILDTISSGIISFDDDLEIVYFNRFAEDIFGYRSAEVLSKPLSMLIPGWAREAPRGFMSRRAENKGEAGPSTAGPIPLTGFRKSGKEIPLELMVARAELEPGNLYTATIRDATYRNQIEASERDQRTMAEALSSAAFTLNSTLDLHEVLDHILAYVKLVVPHDGANIMLVEDQVARIVCLAGEYIRHGREGAFLGYELMLDRFENLLKVLSTRQSTIIEDTLANTGWVRVEGAEWVRSSINVPISLSDHVIGFLNLDSKLSDAFDPQDAHRLEVFAAHAAIAIRNAQLYEAEHFQRLLAESLQQTTEAMARSTAANDNLPLMLVRLQELIGCSWAAVFLLKNNDLELATSVGLPQPDDMGLSFQYQAIPMFYEPLSSGQPLVIRDVQLRPDKESQPDLGVTLHGWIGASIVAWDIVIGYLAVGSAAPTTYSKHQIGAVRSFAYQAALILQNSEVFSELEISRSDLNEAQVRLARAAQLQVAGEIATGIAHQVNNPLTTVIAESYLLAKYLPPDSKHYESVAAIREAAYRAGTVIQRLVDFARAKPFALGPLDVNESVSNAVALLRAQIEPHIARLTLDLADNIPSIQGSERHLEDVWLKLLLNARDAIDTPGSGDIRLTTSYDKQNDQIVVTIRDNGHGIPPDRLDKIFKPFYTTKDKGIGLGLSICRDVISKHRGSVRIDSTLHEGTTAMVILPVGTRHRRE